MCVVLSGGNEYPCLWTAQLLLLGAALASTSSCADAACTHVYLNAPPTACAGKGSPCGEKTACVGDEGLYCVENTCSEAAPFDSVWGVSCDPETTGSFVCGNVQLDHADNPLYCTWSERQCLPAARGLGDLVTGASQCGSGTSMDGFCVGKREGEPCDRTEDCGFNLYCPYPSDGSDQICVRRIMIGDRCTFGSDSCESGSLCLGTNGICTAYMTLPDGTAVDDGAAGLCESGFAVRFTHEDDKCATYNSSLVGQPCTADEGGLTCACTADHPSSSAGYLVPSRYNGGIAEMAAYLQCARQSGCPVPQGFFLQVEAASCLYYACRKEFIALECSRGQFGPPDAAVLRKLGFPECMQEHYAAVYGSSESCASYYSACAQLPDGRGKCT